MLTFLVPVKVEINRIHTYHLWLERALMMGLNTILIFDGPDTNLIDEKKLINLTEKYNGFKYFIVDLGSPGEARNYGLTKVSTSWVAFVDSDDNIFVENYLNLIHKCQSERKTIGIGYFSVKGSSMDIGTGKSNSLTFFNRVRYPGIWRYVFLTDRIRKTQFCNSKSGEDIAFLANLQIRKKELCIGDELLYEYNRDSPGQLTQSLQVNSQLLISLEAAIRNQIKSIPLSIFTLALIFKIALQLIKLKLFKREKSTELVLAGGMGNQLFQIAGALSLSSTLPIYLNHTLGRKKNGGDQNILQILRRKQFREKKQTSSLFKSKYVSLALRISAKGFKKLDQRILRTLLEEFGHVFLFRKRVYIDRLPRNGKLRNQILIGYFQNIDEDRMISSSDFQKYLDQSNSLEFRNIFKEINCERSLVIHVRGGDYTNEKSIGLLGEDYFKNAIAKCLAITEIESFIIFTNDLERCQNVIPPEILKVAKIYSSEDVSTTQSLLAMTKAKNLIISNSTFSWWSAYLGESTIDNVFYPKPWFRSSSLIPTRVRKHWLPIDHDFLD